MCKTPFEQISFDYIIKTHKGPEQFLYVYESEFDYLCVNIFLSIQKSR